jgi:hypothetical protein
MWFNNLNLGNTIEYNESIQLKRLEKLVRSDDGKSMIRLNLDISSNKLHIYQLKVLLLQFKRSCLKNIGMI